MLSFVISLNEDVVSEIKALLEIFNWHYVDSFYEIKEMSCYGAYLLVHFDFK